MAGQLKDKDLMASRKKRNLKSTLVEPFKQIKLGLYVIGITLAFVVVSAFLFAAAVHDQYRHVMAIFEIADPSTQYEVMSNAIVQRNAIRIGVLFVAFIGILYATVFRLTHRYYGPLVSIERFVDQISSGQYARRVTIRDKDELQRLVGKLNRMAEALEKRHGKGSPVIVKDGDDEEDDIEAAS